MNRELFTVRPEELAKDVLRQLLSLGISAAPVVDAGRRPLGILAMRDLIGREEQRAQALMAKPPLVIDSRAPIREAGRLLAETGFHHLVVVDAEGRAVGMISSLDVIRGLLGMPAVHPDVFPHFDPRSQSTWTDDHTLSFDQLEAAPDAPGASLLVHGGAGVPERVVWGEAVPNIRARLKDMLAEVEDNPPLFREWQARGKLRFRATRIEDPEERRLVLKRILDSELS